ncbi:MAG: DNA-binding protein [Candidatus Obscuribacterales bacterium]|nr:DNA-binding protein [Candidatus Obscuribacterales bacterium]
MGRKAYFTEQEVLAAADRLAAAGKEVTASALLDVLGGGSLTTIYKHLNVWRESRPSLVQQVVPGELPEPVQTAFMAAWKVAAGEAAKEAAAVKERAVEEVRVVSRQFAEAQEHIARLEGELEASAGEVDDLKKRLAELEEAIQKSDLERAALAAKSEQLEAQVGAVPKLETAKEEAQKHAAQLEGQLEFLKKQNSELIDKLGRKDK